MKIHREGYRTLLLVFTLLLVADILLFVFILNGPAGYFLVLFVSLLIFSYFYQFFMDPARNIAKKNGAVLAPADGKVVVIEETYESEYFKASCLQVSIFMSPFNVHSNRSPVTGRVKYLKYHPGKFLVAWNPKSSELNERATIVIEDEKGQEILLRQIAGAVARRIVTYPGVGDRVEQGEEIGFIKFGSRVDIFLPAGTPVEVIIGDKTLAGITAITQNIK
ncbi:MAG: phosphatidylserine decarboxylase family protein [Marinilabiliaceae bacterium]|nr:phosphatidylserine decarboxylase family protein [Marinilabiliaceae bacterium]